MDNRKATTHISDIATFSQLHQLDHLCQLRTTQVLSGKLNGKQLHNMLEDIDPSHSEIYTHSEAIPDSSLQSLCLLHLSAQGEIQRHCQRCLEPMRERINFSIRWQVVRAITRPSDIRSGYEILETKEYDGIIPLFMQEILLNIANIPMHPSQKCPMVIDELPHNSPSEQVAIGNTQFAALGQYAHVFRKSSHNQSTGE